MPIKETLKKVVAKHKKSTTAPEGKKRRWIGNREIVIAIGALLGLAVVLFETVVPYEVTATTQCYLNPIVTDDTKHSSTLASPQSLTMVLSTQLDSRKVTKGCLFNALTSSTVYATDSSILFSAATWVTGNAMYVPKTKQWHLTITQLATPSQQVFHAQSWFTIPTEGSAPSREYAIVNAGSTMTATVSAPPQAP